MSHLLKVGIITLGMWYKLLGWNIWKIWGNDGVPPFSGTIVHFDQVLAGKIIFVFFCEFESSGNSVIHCKGGTLPKKRWISKDVWNTFLLWFWMRFGDHRALYHVPIVIIPTLDNVAWISAWRDQNWWL